MFLFFFFLSLLPNIFFSFFVFSLSYPFFFLSHFDFVFLFLLSCVGERRKYYFLTGKRGSKRKEKMNASTQIIRRKVCMFIGRRKLLTTPYLKEWLEEKKRMSSCGRVCGDVGGGRLLLEWYSTHYSHIFGEEKKKTICVCIFLERYKISFFIRTKMNLCPHFLVQQLCQFYRSSKKREKREREPKPLAPLPRLKKWNRKKESAELFSVSLLIVGWYLWKVHV